MSATAAPRDRTTGRFAPRPRAATCTTCGWVLAESLAGYLYCAHEQCQAYRQPAGVAAGVNPGTVTADVLEVGRG